MMKAADVHTLSETKTECKEKSLSFQEKQKLRAEEIEALQKATEILQSPDVLGHANTYLAAAQVQPRASTSLLQTANGASEQNHGVHRRVRDFLASEGQRSRVRDFLASEGQRLHSQSLTLLA